MKFSLITLVMVLMMNINLQAQQMLGLSYDLSFPTSETQEFVSNVSALGFGLDARKMTHGKYSYGITFHWNSFTDDRLEKVDTGENNTIIIDDRSLESFPLMVNAHYYFFTEVESFRPLLGLNAGTYFIITRQNVDGRYRSDTNWHFGIAPDVGFMLHFMQDVHMMITLRYNYAFKAGGSPAQSYFSILFGFVSISLF